MDIKTLIVKRHQLQHDLARMISGRVTDFVAETGVFPESICVNMVDVTSNISRSYTGCGETTMGLTEQEYVVGSVTVSLAI